MCSSWAQSLSLAKSQIAVKDDYIILVCIVVLAHVFGLVNQDFTVSVFMVVHLDT